MNYEAHYNKLIERAQKEIGKDMTTIMRWLKNGKAQNKEIG